MPLYLYIYIEGGRERESGVGAVINTHLKNLDGCFLFGVLFFRFFWRGYDRSVV